MNVLAQRRRGAENEENSIGGKIFQAMTIAGRRWCVYGRKGKISAPLRENIAEVNGVRFALTTL